MKLIELTQCCCHMLAAALLTSLPWHAFLTAAYMLATISTKSYVTDSVAYVERMYPYMHDHKDEAIAVMFTIAVTVEHKLIRVKFTLNVGLGLELTRHSSQQHEAHMRLLHEKLSRPSSMCVVGKHSQQHDMLSARPGSWKPAQHPLPKKTNAALFQKLIQGDKTTV